MQNLRFKFRHSTCRPCGAQSRGRGTAALQALVLSCSLGLSAALALPGAATAAAQQDPCGSLTYKTHRYTVCRFDLRQDAIRIVHRASDGQPYRSFDRLADDLAKSGTILTFGMNGGMYHANLDPVGLLVVNGQELAPLNRSRWLGNFYLKPNGVFAVLDGKAAVLETEAYRNAGLKPRFATQSGPMLVIDGTLHPRFLVGASSRHIRNGVGVREDGTSVVFAISEDKVTFHEFGSLFKDQLETPNALYLDGSISRLFAANLARNDTGDDMGPIITVTAPRNPPQPSQGDTP